MRKPLLNIVKYIVVIAGVLLCSGFTTMPNDNLVLVFDSTGTPPEIAKRFRVIEYIRASGSGQFSADELPNILNTIPVPKSDVWIVDLRQEAHGFIDGLPIAWVSDQNAANAGKTPTQIKSEENKLLQELRKQKTVMVYELKKQDEGRVAVGQATPMIPESVESEQHLVTSLGARYMRIYVQDHNKPDDLAVDQFVAFVRNKVQPSSWLHFHCRGGGGRSSTFLAMYDIIQNAQTDSFNAIMRRQEKSENSKLNKLLHADKAWKNDSAQERFEFLREFYAYVQDDTGYLTRSWSAWRKLNDEHDE
jgi:hypothetical protein